LPLQGCAAVVLERRFCYIFPAFQTVFAGASSWLPRALLRAVETPFQDL
jgi:hypothetical protein